MILKAKEEFKIDYIDPSSFSCFKRCQVRYLLSRLMALEKPDRSTIALDYGTDMHEALPHCYKMSDLDTAISIFKERWSKRGHEWDDKRNTNCAEASLTEFCSNHSRMCPYEVLELPITAPTNTPISKNEIPFLIDIGGHLPLAGRIDAAVRWKADGTLWALDYKGHPLSTSLPTKDGFIKMGDIKVGTKLLTISGEETEVIGVFPLGKRSVYKVTLNDGSVVDTTDDHIWTLVRDDDSKKCNKTTKEIMQLKKKRRYTLPKVLPIKIPLRYVPIEPYTLGVILGDGCIREDGVTISTCDSEIMQRVRKYYSGSDRLDSRNYVTNFSITEILPSLRSLGLMGTKSKTKFIPDCYIFNNEYIRLEILRGLMDTDGSVTNHGTPVFVTTSPDLALGVKLLVESLGGMSNIRVEQAMFNGISYGLKYVQNIRFDENLDKMFHLQRKRNLVVNKKEKALRRIESIELDRIEDCQCIKVDNKDMLYLVEDFIPTHNTSGEVSPRLFKNFENCPQAIGYTLALSNITGEQAKGFIIEAIRVSAKNQESQLAITCIKPCQIESFVEQCNDISEQILRCNEKKEWKMNFSACSPYSQFGSPGYPCDYIDICTNPDKEEMMKFFKKGVRYHPYEIGE